MPNGTIPAIAALTLTVSAALASGAGINQSNLNGDVLKLTRAEASIHATQVFNRADLDKSGALDADEFASLSIVTSELAHLNGYIVVEGAGDTARSIALPIEAPVALETGERARVEAVARNTFYATAGADGLISEAEFVNAEVIKFNDADRNRNGTLAKKELARFAIGQAQITAGV